MTTLIKIKRSSIKRNPHAFSTETPISLRPEYTFKYEGYNPPKWIYSKDVSIDSHELIGLIEWKLDVITGRIFDRELFERLYKIEIQNREKGKYSGLNLTYTQNSRIFHHMPEPEYLYEYKNTKIKCSECHSLVRVNKIQSDEIDDNLVDVCPICGGINTFDFKYEKISDAIKN